MLPTIQVRGRSSAKSNAERQRDFRARHPGYYQRIHAARRARTKAYVTQVREIERLMRAMFPPLPLMLPAPVEQIEIPEMTTIGRLRSREAIEIATRA
jgi:hypothetical protein